MSAAAKAKHILGEIAIATIGAVLGLMLFAALVTLLAVCCSALAQARDDGQWSNQPPEIRLWFQSVMQPGNSKVSCCGEGDAFEVLLDGNDDEYIRAIIVNGRGMVPDGTLVMVPRVKLQAKYGNPTDHIILFLNTAGNPLCLIPKVGA